VSIDPSSVFDLFDSGSDERLSQPDQEYIKYIDVSEHPIILMGMFTRIVLRGEEINKEIMKFFQEIDYNISRSSREHVNKYMIYTRALHFLSQLDLKNPFHAETLAEKAGEDFLEACGDVIEFFAEREEYEKCQLVKEFQDFIKFSQNKLPL